jgi:hypothetical protein
MLLSIPAGTTSKIIQVPIYDSSSTIGAKLAGLVYNTASLTAYYNREGAAGAATAITLATATKGTWVTGGFIAIDATNIPGAYELHLPNAALATGAKSLYVSLKGATNLVPLDILIELTATSNQDAVRGGMTALPNVASGSAGAVITSGTGTAQLSVSSGLVTLAGVTHTGAVIPTVSTLTGHTAQTGDNFARLGAPAGASIAADLLVIDNFVDGLETTIGAAGAGLTALSTQASVDAIKVDTAAILVDTGTTLDAALAVVDANVDAILVDTADMQPKLGAPAGASISADIAAVKADSAAILIDTAEIGAAGAGLTNITINAASVDAIWDEDIVAAHTTADTAGAKLAAAGGAADPWSTALPGAYGAGTAGKIVGDNINAPIGTVSTNVNAILVDTGTTLDAAIAAVKADTAAVLIDTADMQPKLGAPAGASVSADIAAVKADTAATLIDTAEIGVAGAGLTALVVDVTKVGGDAGAATKLKRVLLGNVTGTVGAASTTTNIVTSTLSPAASVTDQYKGRIVTFDDVTTTAALRGQSTDITASTSGGQLTVTALTTAPVSGDTFTVS